MKTIASIWGKICSEICPWTLSVPRSSHFNFPRASLSENCSLLGTDNVRGQISEHIFTPNGDCCLRLWQTGTHCCRHKCFPVCPCAQHLLRTQILCPGHKNVSDFAQKHYVRNKCCLRIPRNIMGNNASATMCPRLPEET